MRQAPDIAAFNSGRTRRRSIGLTRRDDLLILCARIGFNPPDILRS